MAFFQNGDDVLSIINLTNVSAGIDIILYRKDGQLLRDIPVNLDAHQRYMITWKGLYNSSHFDQVLPPVKSSSNPYLIIESYPLERLFLATVTHDDVVRELGCAARSSVPS